MSKKLLNINNFNKSIAKKVIFYSFLASSTFTLFLTLFQVFQDYRYAVDSVEENLESIQLSTLNALSSSLWSFDRNQVEILLKGIHNINNIQYVELKAEPSLSMRFV
jgi:hypothetical protein